MAQPRPKPETWRAQSRTTNGRQFLEGIDGRTAKARRARDVFHEIARDRGGADRLSQVQQQLVRRFSGLSAMAEGIETDWCNDKAIDLAAYTLIASTLVRLASRIGLGRHAKQIPVLADYLQAKDAERVEIIEPNKDDEDE
jgi:hypothetical protein